jgi:hypothetical protein
LDFGASSNYGDRPTKTIRELFKEILKMHSVGLDWKLIAREITHESRRQFGINQVSQKPWPSSLQPRGVEIIYDTGEKICFTGWDWLYFPARYQPPVG